MYCLKYSKHFKKDIKRFRHDSALLFELEKVLEILIQGKGLPAENFNHQLKGEFKNCFECHLKPDILLIFKKEKSKTTILLLRIGSHSDLF